MKIKRTVSVSFVSHDGKEFKTKKACEKYESEHPEPIISQLDAELNYVNVEINCHKHYCGKDSSDDICRTWHCGKKHQEALKLIRDSKPKKGQPRYEYLIELGKLAEDVQRWKHNEKVAVDGLMKLRSRRNMLANELSKIKSKLATAAEEKPVEEKSE